MAQLVIDISVEAAERLAKEAAERGLTVEAVAVEAVEAWVTFDDDDWEEGDRRMNEGGASIPMDQVFDALEARVAAHFANKK